MTSHGTKLQRRTGLPPVVGEALRVLILGSFPGERSLAAGAYYAHPRNRLWPSLAPLIGAPADAPYESRLDALRRAGLGLWDVLVACERRGSLDQAIVPERAIPSDLGALAAVHPELRAIVLNGQSVARLFHLFQLPRPLWPHAGIRIEVLPSTSPAHARMPDAEVQRRWQRALARLLAGRGPAP